MSRFTMVLAAAVATGMVVIAVSTLDAVGADPPTKAADDVAGQFADCLRSRDVAVPALSGAALERWLQTHRVPDSAARACKIAIAPPADRREAPSADATKLSQCVRAQGFDVPSDPMALKQWIGEQRSPAALRAIKDCGVGDPAPCGAPKEREAPQPSPARSAPDADPLQ